jgi:large subunit ribosomal protein L15
MELHNLKPAKGSVKSEKRIGRGEGSGKGGTSTRGHKGAKSRSGYKSKRAFEGGQMPLQMRLPKRGFKNPNRVEYVALNISTIENIAEKYNISDITPDILIEKGIVRKNDRIKILGTGDATKKINVTAHAASKSAVEKLQNAGGSLNLV